MNRSQLESPLILTGWHTARSLGEYNSATEVTLTNYLSGRSSEWEPEGPGVHQSVPERSATFQWDSVVPMGACI